MKSAFSGKIEGIESEEEMRLIDADYLLDVLLVHNWHGNNKNIVPYKDRKGYRQREAEVREAIINAPNVAVVVDGKYKGAYEYIYKGVMSKIEECENAEEILTTDLKAGEKGFGLSRKCFEVRVKKELLREIIYIVDDALEEGSAE